MTWRPLPSPPAERDPRRVSESLERIAAGLGAAAPSLLTSVFVQWEELVGPNVAAHATPRSLRGGVLTVSVDHPAWATTLRLLSADLLRRAAGLSGGASGVGGGSGGEITELVVHVDLPGRDRLAPPAGPRPSEAGGSGDGSPRRGDALPRRGDALPRRGDALPARGRRDGPPRRGR